MISKLDYIMLSAFRIILRPAPEKTPSVNKDSLGGKNHFKVRKNMLKGGDFSE